MAKRKRERWQDDKDFCAWLLRMEYATQEDGALSLRIGDGLTLYCWEAWRAGIKRERDRGVSDLLHDVARACGQLTAADEKRCKYCLQKDTVFCAVCRQFWRADRLWRIEAVFMSDNGVGPFSIAERLGRSAYTEIIPLLLACKRLRGKEWAPHLLQWERVRGSGSDESIEFYDILEG